MLAIDPSLTSTGYAFRSQSGQETATVVGSIQPKKMRGMERILFIEDRIKGLVAELQPKRVVYEGYAMGVRSGHVFDRAELGGVLKRFIWEQGIDIILVPPKSLKLFATGNGNADKDAMMRVLAQHRGRLFNNSDEADAYGLLLCGEAFCDRRLLPRVRGNYKHAAVAGFEVVKGKR